MKKKSGPRCAQCGKNIVLSDKTKDLWPFCSKRCKIIDLGKWLGEKYVVTEGSQESPPIDDKNDHGHDDE